MSQDRRHHYVPAFYLALFTASKTEAGDLWVFDGEQVRTWPSSPRDAAHQRDFNRVEVTDLDPLTVEKDIFGDLESKAAPVIKGWCSRANGVLTLGMPGFAMNFEELSVMVTFIAGQSIRVPRRREAIDQFHTDVTRRTIEAISKSEETFARAQEKSEPLRELSRADVLEILADPGFRVTVDVATYFRNLLPTMDPITDLLGSRKWGIVVAPADGPDFICSDDPVVLLPPDGARSFFGVGFGTPGSTVYLPLSSRHALLGIELEPSRPPIFNVAVTAGSASSVATLNRSLIVHAHRFLYAGKPDFAWMRNDMQIGGYEDLRRTRLASAEASAPVGGRSSTSSRRTRAPRGSR